MTDSITDSRMDDFDGWWLSMFADMTDSQLHRVGQLLTTYHNTALQGGAVADGITSIDDASVAPQEVSQDLLRFSQASTIVPFQYTGVLNSYGGNRGIPEFDQSNIQPFTLAPSIKGNPPTTKKKFFCTTCLENGVFETFGAKSDCKRHETVFHETDIDWKCGFKDCQEVFSRKQDASSHRARHGSTDGHQYHAIALHPRQIHACGFDSCSTLKTSWEDLFNHKATHMKKLETNWSRTTRVLNLMRHETIKPTWKALKPLFQQCGFNACQMIWHPKTTRYLVRQLECLTFSLDPSDKSYGFAPDLPSLLQQLWAIGSTAAAAALTGEAAHITALDALEGTLSKGASYPESDGILDDIPTAIHASGDRYNDSAPDPTIPFLGLDGALDASQVPLTGSDKRYGVMIPDTSLYPIEGSLSREHDTLVSDLDDGLDPPKGSQLINQNRHSVLMEDASPYPIDHQGFYTSPSVHNTPLDPKELVNNQKLGSWPLSPDASDMSPPRTTAPRHTAGNARAFARNNMTTQRPSTSQTNMLPPSTVPVWDTARSSNLFARHFMTNRRPATSHSSTSPSSSTPPFSFAR